MLQLHVAIKANKKTEKENKMVGFDKLHDLLQQEVSRKEFLRYMGVALLGLLGVAGLIQNLTSTSIKSSDGQQQKRGYGASAYGR